MSIAVRPYCYSLGQKEIDILVSAQFVFVEVGSIRYYYTNSILCYNELHKYHVKLFAHRKKDFQAKTNLPQNDHRMGVALLHDGKQRCGGGRISNLSASLE